MGRIDGIFADVRSRGATALMPFICGGHPGPGDAARLIPALEAGGASVVEVGFPFSDPIADGPAIAAAMHRALEQGATPRTVLEEIASVRERVSLGVVAMVSVSIVYRMGGPGAFARECAGVGVDGLIVPDVPLEESAPLVSGAAEHGLSCSLLVAPTTPPGRAAEIARASTGFVYLVATAGLTGERPEAPQIAQRVRVIREATDLPVACGFGISTREQVRAVTQHADAAIVGSALVRRLEEALRQGRDIAADARVFVGQLASGLSTSGRT